MKRWARQYQLWVLAGSKSAVTGNVVSMRRVVCTPLLQVKRWARQYQLSVQAGAQPLREVLALIDWLRGHIPPGDDDASASRLSHGDFRCWSIRCLHFRALKAPGTSDVLRYTRNRTCEGVASYQSGADVAGLGAVLYLQAPPFMCVTPGWTTWCFFSTRRIRAGCWRRWTGSCPPSFVFIFMHFSHCSPISRLDNLVFDEEDPTKVLAVLDWELSTIGDPLADLAYACMPYHLPSVRRLLLHLYELIFLFHLVILNICCRTAPTSACPTRPLVPLSCLMAAERHAQLQTRLERHIQCNTVCLCHGY